MSVRVERTLGLGDKPEAESAAVDCTEPPIGYSIAIVSFYGN